MIEQIKKSGVVFNNAHAAGFAALLFGLLYISAFMYGFFWLWIAPFTGVIILFMRAMIDDAIIRVAQKGDAAVQAKAMIPEFIKMNIVMTVFLSLPFVSALWLNHAGHIQVIQQSAADQELWRFCLWILRKQDQFKQIKFAQIQITLSSMFFMYFSMCIFPIFLWNRLKKVAILLFHKASYKFLQKVPTSHSPISLFGAIIILFHLYILSLQLVPIPSFSYGITVIIFFGFLIQYQTICIVSYWIITKVLVTNLITKE